MSIVLVSDGVWLPDFMVPAEQVDPWVPLLVAFVVLLVAVLLVRRFG